MRRLLVMAAMCVLATGCGGDDGDDEATASSTTEVDAEDVDTTTTGADATTTTAEGAGGGGGTVDVDPCSLITADEAADLIGADVGVGQSTPFEAGTACIYQGGGSIVGVQVFSAPGTEELLAANAPLFASDAVPADGIGEAAFVSEAEASIGVLQDGVIFTVTVVADGQPAAPDVVRAAADLALANL